MADFDVAIVGGGPVGLVAATEARLAGLSAIVIEPHEGVLDKACGEGLMPGALPLLARLGVDPPGMPIGGISYVQGSHRVTHRFAGSPGRGVRRLELHSSLAARADELGVAREAAKVSAIEQSSDGVSVAGITARYLLGCDGLHSSVAALAGLALPAPAQRRRYGIRQHFAVAPWTDTVEVHYAKRAEIYITPIAENEVGVAMLGPQRTDFDAVIAESAELSARLAGAGSTSARRGAGPFRQRTRARTAGRVLLVGDASGYVDAITGEGLRLGFAQAAAAIAAVAADAPSVYEAEWKSLTRDFRRTTSALVFFASSPLRGAIVPLSATLPSSFGSVVESLAR